MQISFKFNYLNNNMTIWHGTCVRNGGETAPGEDFEGMPLDEFRKAGSGVFHKRGPHREIIPDRLAL